MEQALAVGAPEIRIVAAKDMISKAFQLRQQTSVTSRGTMNWRTGVASKFVKFIIRRHDSCSADQIRLSLQLKNPCLAMATVWPAIGMEVGSGSNDVVSSIYSTRL